MNKRIITCGLVLSVLVAGLPAIGISTAQDVPTANPATVDAMVQQRFDATQSYAAFGTLNVTVDAAFATAQTATAAAPTILVTNTQLVPTLAANSSVPTITPIPPNFDLPALITPEFVFIPAVDNFQMGTTFAEVATAVNQCTIDEQGNCTVEMAQDSLPVHTVKLTAFQMQRDEVTVNEFTVFLNSRGAGSHLNGCEGQPCALTRDQDQSSPILYDGKTYSGGNLPMFKVTWYGAKAFCEAAGGRLPTEAEWEYAARGTDGRIYPWGNNWDPLNARTSVPVTTNVGPVAIGSYVGGLSPFGLFDMAGNVAEWVSDWYDPTYYSLATSGGTNPAGSAAGSEKVIRGGSWDSKPFFARSVHRQSLAPQAATNGTGFRCATDAPAVIPTLTPVDTVRPPTAIPSAQANLVISPTAAPNSIQPAVTETAAG